MFPLETTMAEAGRKEKEDLEEWIKNSPSLLGGDILIIGEQVQTRSGPMDLLAIDAAGNAVIIELKKDKIPREALAQAIDYASDVASWDVDKLNELCEKYKGQPLDEYMGESFEDLGVEDISLNQAQRILLVGTYIEESLQRMIEWLSGNYELAINAVVLRYIRTKGGEELIGRTVIIPEEIEKERSQKQQRKIPMSDEPGNYDDDELRNYLMEYLSSERPTPRRVREILLPLCVDHEPVRREEIKNQLIKIEEVKDEGRAGLILTTISRALGIPQRDYLRQVIRYEKVSPWEKENYRIEEKYKDMIRELLDELTMRKKGSGPVQ